MEYPFVMAKIYDMDQKLQKVVLHPAIKEN